MPERQVDRGVVGARFSPYEFTWDWSRSQMIARAAGCAIDDPRDRPLMLPDSTSAGHPMVAFNGALLARNRDEVMERLIGGYAAWQEVGRWGSGHVRFARPLPRAGAARVGCAFTEVGGTSKGHALVRFAFEVDDLAGGGRLAEGWMLLFLLGCGSEALGKLAPPRIAMPERAPDVVVEHDTPPNTTFDWALPSGDWNTTHFETRPGNPAPLVHGPRNMALVLNDAARELAGGQVARLREITLGSLPAPHYPGEPTRTLLWRESADTALARLVVPAGGRRDGGGADKVAIDQIEIRFGGT